MLFKFTCTVLCLALLLNMMAFAVVRLENGEIFVEIILNSKRLKNAYAEDKVNLQSHVTYVGSGSITNSGPPAPTTGAIPDDTTITI